MPVKITAVIVAGLALATIFGAGWWSGAASTEREYQRQQIAATAALHQAEKEQQDAIFAAEHAAALATNAADIAYLNGVEDGKQKTDRLVADLRAGNLRLSARINAGGACQAGTPAGTTGGGDAETRAELSRTDSEFLLRLGAEADDIVKQLTACQAIVRADRG